MNLKPISFSGGVKSISDDDLCSTCSNCEYRPGEMSGCRKGWPGLESEDGYVQQCEQNVQADLDSWTSKPVCCPYCGGKEIVEIVEWESTSREDDQNTCGQTEYQCKGTCEGRSFWC